MKTLVLALCLVFILPDAAISAAPAKKARAARQKPAAKAPETPSVSAAELQNPYSALAGGNATGWRFDPTPRGLPFGRAADDAGGGTAGTADEDQFLRLRIGREEVVDPLTQKSLTPKADPQKAKESLKNMNLKDAMDKSGGKAEVQVNILKF